MDRRILTTRLLHARVAPGGRRGRGASLPEWDRGGARVGHRLRAGRRSLARPRSVSGRTAGRAPRSGSGAGLPDGRPGRILRCGSTRAPREQAGLRNLASLGRLLFDFSFRSVSSPPGRTAAPREAPGRWAPGSRAHLSHPGPVRPLCRRPPPLAPRLCGAASALGCPGARRAVPRDPPQLQPLGFPCEIPARLPTPTPKSPEPPPRPSAPPLGLH